MAKTVGSGSTALATPSVAALGDVVNALRSWQCDEAPVQLHPGDVGWQWRFGAAATAAALRTWTRDGEILAVGMEDSPGLIRLALAPRATRDEELTHQIVADLSEPERGVLPSGPAAVEVRFGGLLAELLLDLGWVDDEEWTPLQRDLTNPVEDGGLRIEVTSEERAELRADVQRAAFESSTFSKELWLAMAAGIPFGDARCLIAYDGDTAVAAATVWSAGPGKPGLLEPVGVHRDHRGHGYGTAVTLAAAAALRELGSSFATVCTRSDNVGAVATYASAGFEQLPDVPDLRRHA
jgi:ribosomal protein S18 acetylase RimI-like enzyme